MKKLTPADKLDAVLMNCPVEELPALIDRAQLVAKIRGLPQPKRTRKPKETVQESTHA